MSIFVRFFEIKAQ